MQMLQKLPALDRRNEGDNACAVTAAERLHERDIPVAIRWRRRFSTAVTRRRVVAAPGAPHAEWLRRAVQGQTMIRMLSLALLLAGCPGGGGSSMDKPDAAITPDAPKPKPDAPPSPPPPPLKGYGETCTSANQCASGLCIGETGSPHVCSVPCNIEVANDCRAVDGFCVPIGGGDHGCFGMIETGNDLDDAILNVGDNATRSLTPLNDADMFRVKLNQLGTIRFTASPSQSIDVKLEAYDMIGAPVGSSNDVGPSMAEALETNVQQIGGHIFLVVRNVGTSTGPYTFSVAKVPGAFAPTPPNISRSLDAAP